MSGPGEGTPFIEHEPPKHFPTHSYVGIAVPAELSQQISKEAAATGVCFEDQLLKWAQIGARCARLHWVK